MLNIDSLVQEIRKNNLNYKIIYKNYENSNQCIIYFSSNGVYFPYTEDVFKKMIIEDDRYEWFQRDPFKEVAKTIFIRDIFLNWYMNGISYTIDSPEKLLDFLKKETNGYEVITVGASSGGYAALAFGLLLKATRIFSFAPQINLSDMPVKNIEDFKQSIFFDIKPLLIRNINTEIFWFFSGYNEMDLKQYKLIEKNDIKGLNVLKYKSYHHGIPFPTFIIGLVLINPDTLKKWGNKIIHPKLFAWNMIISKGNMSIWMIFFKKIYQYMRFLIYGKYKNVQKPI